MKRELLESKSWDYYLYKLEDSKLELSVVIPSPSPGFEVSQILSEQDKKKYLEKGIEVLRDNMELMKNNPSNYKMTSLR